MTALVGAPLFIFIAARFLNDARRSPGRFSAAGFRLPSSAAASCGVKIAASIVLTLLALGLYSLSRGSYPLPASTLARALLAPQEMGEQPRFILFDIRLPRILMALLCGAMLGLAGAAMQSITRNGLADPGLIGVKEGPASWSWRWCCFSRR